MRKLVASLVLLLVGSVLPGSPATADTAPYVDPPFTYVPERQVIGLSGWVLLGERVTVALEDPVSEPTHVFDVQLARGSMRSATRPRWRTVLTGTRALHHDFRPRQGRVLCARARIRDTATGGTSAWSSSECVVRPLDDSRMIRRGSMSIRASRHFADGKATILHPYGRLLVRGIPAGASFGAVMIPKTGDQWYSPYSHLVGEHRQGRLVQEDNSRHVYFQTYEARRRGTAVVEGRAQLTEPVGGFVVLPRWIYR